MPRFARWGLASLGLAELRGCLFASCFRRKRFNSKRPCKTEHAKWTPRIWKPILHRQTSSQAKPIQCQGQFFSHYHNKNAPDCAVAQKCAWPAWPAWAAWPVWAAGLGPAQPACQVGDASQAGRPGGPGRPSIHILICVEASLADRPSKQNRPGRPGRPGKPGTPGRPGTPRLARQARLAGSQASQADQIGQAAAPKPLHLSMKIEGRARNHCISTTKWFIDAKTTIFVYPNRMTTKHRLFLHCQMSQGPVWGFQNKSTRQV